MPIFYVKLVIIYYYQKRIEHCVHFEAWCIFYVAIVHAAITNMLIVAACKNACWFYKEIKADFPHNCSTINYPNYVFKMQA